VGGEESGIVPFEEDESELTDLELVSMAEKQAIDSLLVDIRAIQRPSVTDNVPLGGALDLDVTPRDRDVVKADLRFGMAPEPRDIFVERKASPGLCSSPHNEDANLGRQLPHRNYYVVIEARRVLQWVDRGQRDRSVVEGIQR
jgi:hypothetical protein